MDHLKPTRSKSPPAVVGRLLSLGKGRHQLGSQTKPGHDDGGDSEGVVGLETQAGDWTYQEAAQAQEEGAEEDDQCGGDLVRDPAPHRVEHGVTEPVQHEDDANLTK